jgi:putative oxidoreductase
MDIGILLLRATLGLTLAAHGAQKLFGWFGGPGLAGTAQGMEMLGFHPGRRHALMAGLVEVSGGLMLALGFLTPLGVTLVCSVMLVAAFSVHVRQGFFITSGGYEYNLVLGMAALSVAFMGGGTVSVDALLGYSFSGVFWGTAALLVALVGAAIQLAGRRVPAAAQAATA